MSTKQQALAAFKDRTCGMLTATGRAVQVAAGRWMLECVCECGRPTLARPSAFEAGTRLSCGCSSSARMAKLNTTHGGRSLPEYRVWSGVINRCTNPNNPAYPYYGGRGIAVCSEWLASFAAFHRDMGSRPSNSHVIDRIDNSAGYSPSNCRWATHRESTLNRDVTRSIEFRGEVKALSEWAELLGINYRTLWHRIVRRGWSVEDAFSTLAAEYPPRYTWRGESLTLVEWARRLGVKPDTLRSRLHRLKWPADRVFGGAS